MPSIDTLCDRMRYWCDEGNLGYCQEHRWDIYEGGEADCSSLVIRCLQEAGFDTGSASYTGDMSDNLCARGWYRVSNNGNPQRGDILLNDTHHVAVYIGDGLLCQASRNENHGANGGQPGDQDGWETNTRNYYNYPWNCYLRYGGDGGNDENDNYDNGQLEVDGWWGAKTTRRLQEYFGTEQDGVVSSQWADDSWRHAGAPSFDHDYSGSGSMLIRAIQNKLNEYGHGLEVDGLCGEGTINALIDHFQDRSGATEFDGVISGPSITVRAMQQALNEGWF